MSDPRVEVNSVLARHGGLLLSSFFHEASQYYPAQRGPSF